MSQSNSWQLVNCNDGPCLFCGSCERVLALQRSLQAVIDELDKYTFSDLAALKADLEKIVALRAGDRGVAGVKLYLTMSGHAETWHVADLTASEKRLAAMLERRLRSLL